MNARTNAAQLIDQLAKKARPVKPERKTRTGRNTLYLIICPLCVEAGFDQTQHMMRSPKAETCKRHKSAWWSRKHPGYHKADSARRYHRDPAEWCRKQREYYWRHRDERTAAERERWSNRTQEQRDRRNARRRELRARAKPRVDWREIRRTIPATIPADCW